MGFPTVWQLCSKNKCSKRARQMWKTCMTLPQKWKESPRYCRSVVSDSAILGTVATRLLCPWNSPGKNTGVGCHSLLQGIFLTQGSNLGLLHCRQILYRLRHYYTWAEVISVQFSSFQSLSHVRLFATPWIAAHQASLSITYSQSSPKLTSIELVMPSNHLILYSQLLLLPLIPPSIRVFSNESTSHEVAKTLKFQL